MVARDLGNPFDNITAQQAADRLYGIPDAPPPDNALVPHGDGTITYKRFVLRPTGLDIPADLTAEEWTELGGILFRLETSIQWLIGDWTEYAHANWGLSYEDIATQFDYDPRSLRQFTWVCRNIPVSMRIDTLSFTHHSLVASKSADEQAYWLALAVDNLWSVAEMRYHMNPPAPPTPIDIWDRRYGELLSKVLDDLENKRAFNPNDVDELLTWLNALKAKG